MLSWLISLPEGIDPAVAASQLGVLPPFADAQGGETGRVAKLLNDIAQYPARKLAVPQRRRGAAI